MATIDHLPNEVLLMCFERLVDHHGRDHNGDLQALSQTSSRLRRVALPLLYRFIEYDEGNILPHTILDMVIYFLEFPITQYVQFAAFRLRNEEAYYFENDEDYLGEIDTRRDRVEELVLAQCDYHHKAGHEVEERFFRFIAEQMSDWDMTLPVLPTLLLFMFTGLKGIELECTHSAMSSRFMLTTLHHFKLPFERGYEGTAFGDNGGKGRLEMVKVLRATDVEQVNALLLERFLRMGPRRVGIDQRQIPGFGPTSDRVRYDGKIALPELRVTEEEADGTINQELKEDAWENRDGEAKEEAKEKTMKGSKGDVKQEAEEGEGEVVVEAAIEVSGGPGGGVAAEALAVADKSEQEKMRMVELEVRGTIKVEIQEIKDGKEGDASRIEALDSSEQSDMIQLPSIEDETGNGREGDTIEGKEISPIDAVDGYDQALKGAKELLSSDQSGTHQEVNLSDRGLSEIMTATTAKNVDDEIRAVPSQEDIIEATSSDGNDSESDSKDGSELSDESSSWGPNSSDYWLIACPPQNLQEPILEYALRSYGYTPTPEKDYFEVEGWDDPIDTNLDSLNLWLDHVPEKDDYFMPLLQNLKGIKQLVVRLFPWPWYSFDLGLPTDPRDHSWFIKLIEGRKTQLERIHLEHYPTVSQPVMPPSFLPFTALKTLHLIYEIRLENLWSKFEDDMPDGWFVKEYFPRQLENLTLVFYRGEVTRPSMDIISTRVADFPKLVAKLDYHRDVEYCQVTWIVRQLTGREEEHEHPEWYIPVSIRKAKKFPFHPANRSHERDAGDTFS